MMKILFFLGNSEKISNCKKNCTEFYTCWQLLPQQPWYSVFVSFFFEKLSKKKIFEGKDLDIGFEN